MPDTPHETPPAFEVKDGRVFMDGIDVTEVARPGGEDEVPEPANPDNAAVEGDEPEKPEEKAEPVEAKKEDAVPEKKPDVEPEKEPEEAAKLKFKTKFRGKEEDVEYEPTQIQVRLNKLRAFEENEKEFWEKTKEVEPHRAIINSDWYKAKLKEAYETGELAAPEAPAPPPLTVQYEILKRKADPDHDAVMESLRDYARNLPQGAVKILDSDASVFLSEYDRVAVAVRTKVAEKPKVEPAKEKADPEDVRKKLTAKESAKTRAAVVAPGTMPEQRSQATAVQKRMRELERAMRDPAQGNRNLEFAAELIMLRQQAPT